MNYNKIICILVIVLVVLLVAFFVFSNSAFTKKDTAINVTSNNTLNDGDYFSVLLSDVNGNPLANQTVNITIIDANGAENHQQVTTDGSGNGMLQLNGLTPTEYTFNVTYMGNDEYKGCNVSIKITIVQTQQISTSSDESSDWYDSNGAHHFYENGKEYVGSRDGQHMDIETRNYVREHGMAD